MKDFIKKLVADRSVQRGFWTAVELGAGAIAASLTGSVGVGAAVVFVALAIKEAAVRHLGA